MLSSLQVSKSSGVGPLCAPFTQARGLNFLRCQPLRHLLELRESGLLQVIDVCLGSMGILLSGFMLQRHQCATRQLVPRHLLLKLCPNGGELLLECRDLLCQCSLLLQMPVVGIIGVR